MTWREEVVLFFHGFTGSKAYFPDTVGDEVCILSFDRPGVGESSIVEYYSMEGFLEIVHGVLEEHGVTSVKLVGHSAGGYYAQVFAHMYPEMTGSVTLASSMVPLNCPDTKGIVGGQWKFIVTLSLGLKGPSKLYFKKMAKGITGDYDKQLAQNMKALPEAERRFMEENPELIKNAVLSAVANEGLGVCYDAYALCQKRDKVTIPADIPVYIWHGAEDDTIPLSFVEYLQSAYPVRETHVVEGVGHMLYLISWNEIIRLLLLGQIVELHSASPLLQNGRISGEASPLYYPSEPFPSSGRTGLPSAKSTLPFD